MTTKATGQRGRARAPSSWRRGTTSVLLLLGLTRIGAVQAWITSSASRRTTKLAVARDHESSSFTTDCALRRLGLTGVSVAETGFTVLWGLSQQDQKETKEKKKSNKDSKDNQNNHPTEGLLYWPWTVTTPQAGDTAAVTSAQALTLCQLIAGIDLAGSRLPADILAQVVVLTCEENVTFPTIDQQRVADQLVDHIQQQLQRIQIKWSPQKAKAAATEPLSYTDAPAWIRARVRLPLCTLDQILVEPTTTDNNHNNNNNNSFRVTFHVQVRDHGSLVLTHVTDAVLADVLTPLYDDYTFSDETRRAFLTTALSLRYKAPVLMPVAVDEPTNLVADDSITQAFPLYTTVQKVQTPSDRVVSRIEKGWEIHQLQAAYQIALQKQDWPAVAKIRAKLDEMDAMPDLPVQADSELDSMQ